MGPVKNAVEPCLDFALAVARVDDGCGLVRLRVSEQRSSLACGIRDPRLHPVCERVRIYIQNTAMSNHDTGSVAIHGLLPLQVYCVCHGLERMRTRGTYDRKTQA